MFKRGSKPRWIVIIKLEAEAKLTTAELLAEGIKTGRETK